VFCAFSRAPLSPHGIKTAMHTVQNRRSVKNEIAAIGESSDASATTLQRKAFD
jgi:hypothetical protein